MKLFIKNFLVFISPLLLFQLVLAYIDPFNRIHQESDARKRKLKNEIANKINSRLYKLIEYDRVPAATVILGDSRANQLKSDYFEELLHEDVQNLSYGGGTLPEVITTFDAISKTSKISRLYIGISFNLYNGRNSMNLVPEALELKKSAISYINSKYCLKASFLYGKAVLRGGEIRIDEPPFSKEEFWDYQLYSAASNFYSAYSYPHEFFADLKKISAYCSANDIEVIFFVPPTHTDLQKRIEDFQLLKYEKKFKEDLTRLGDVYDFDYPNELTRDRNNFLDPFHPIDSISRLVVKEITEKKVKYARYHRHNEADDLP